MPEFVRAYRTATISYTTSWQITDFDVEVIDTNGMWDGTNKFTADEDGHAFFFWCGKRDTGGYSATGKMLRAYPVDGVAPGTLYGGSNNLKYPAIHTNDFYHQPMASGEYAQFNGYTIPNATISAGITHNLQVLWLPAGEGAIIQRFGITGDGNTLTSSNPGYAQILDFDRILYSDGDWKDDGDDSFTMPADGYLVTQLHMRAVVNVSAQQNYVGFRVMVNDATNDYSYGSRSVRYTSRPTTYHAITPVSEGDVIKYEWNYWSTSSKVYTILGFTTAGDVDVTHLTMSLFPT
jgi:hypothetical protein